MLNGNVLGNPSNAAPNPLGGEALVGGGTVPAATLQFLINQANGGNFVVLTYSSDTAGDDSYADEIWALAGGNTANPKLASVETIAVRNGADATNPDFVKAVSNASAIFITGGDQSNYVSIWGGPPCGCSPNILAAVDTALSNKAAIGGTSAGMAVLGQVAYAATVPPPGGGNLYSRQALAGPGQPAVLSSLHTNFLGTTTPPLTSIVTETHFQPGDRDPQGRMGRLIAFLADMAAYIVSGTPYGIAASNSTAVDIDQNGNATVVAASPLVLSPFVYFVTAPNTVPVAGNNIPLNWQGISIIRVAAGGTFNLVTWTAAAGKKYQINVINGLLSVEGNNDFY